VIGGGGVGSAVLDADVPDTADAMAAGAPAAALIANIPSTARAATAHREWCRRTAGRPLSGRLVGLWS
jgi:hypothetical protein